MPHKRIPPELRRDSFYMSQRLTNGILDSRAYTARLHKNITSAKSGTEISVGREFAPGISPVKERRKKTWTR